MHFSDFRKNGDTSVTHFRRPTRKTCFRCAQNAFKFCRKTYVGLISGATPETKNATRVTWDTGALVKRV